MWQTSLLLAADDDDDDALFWVIVNKVTKASWSELVEQTLQPPFDLIINTNLYIFPMIFLQICTWLHASFHWSTLEFQRQRAVGASLSSLSLSRSSLALSYSLSTCCCTWYCCKKNQLCDLFSAFVGNANNQMIQKRLFSNQCSHSVSKWRPWVHYEIVFLVITLWKLQQKTTHLSFNDGI